MDALEKAGYSVNLVSASLTYNCKKYDSKVVDLCENSKLILFKTLPWGNKINRAMSITYSKFQLVKYILKNIGKEDTLVVYHSVSYANIVRLLKKIKKFRLILEVEEIYSDVNKSADDRKIEFRLFDCDDAYIL